MTERIVPRGKVSPLAIALRLALEEAMETRRRRELEAAEWRGRLRLVDRKDVA